MKTMFDFRSEGISLLWKAALSLLRRSFSLVFLWPHLINGLSSEASAVGLVEEPTSITSLFSLSKDWLSLRKRSR